MADVKFGLGQIKNPTPKWATNVFRIVLYAAAVAGIIIGSISEIPDPVKVVILKYAAEVTLAVHALTKLFGIVIDDDPTSKT